MQQNSSFGVNLKNWDLYLSHSMGGFYPWDSHAMVYFPIEQENASKPTV